MTGFRIQTETFHEAHRAVISRIIRYPDFISSPRGLKVRECLNSSFVVSDPRARLVDSPARKLNYGFAAGELCWYLRGSNDLQTMLYYNKRMDRFSDDGITINSAYGARIFNEEYGDQFRYVVKELCSDPHSRRATLHVNRPADLRHAVSNGSKDVPCTMNLQLFIRDRKLHMSVHMRSNDVIWGMPYDVFSFTMLQECFLAFLIEAKADVDGLGTYHHSAGSIHIYDEFLEQGAAIELEEITAPPPMDPFDIIRIDQISHLHEPVIMKQGSTLPEDELSTWDRSSRWLYDRLVEQHLKRKEENERNT